MAKVNTTKKPAASKLKQSTKAQTSFKPKPKDLNAPKVVKKPKKLTDEQEARQKQIDKDNAKSAEKMNAFVQRPEPKYMSPEQLARKKELIQEKEDIFATVKEMEERLQLLMDPVMVLKNQIGSQKSRLNYIGVEMKTFFGLKEPEEGFPQEVKEEIDGLFVEED